MRYSIFLRSSCPLLNISSMGYSADPSVTHFGPGVRDLFIIHYVLSGKGYFNTSPVCAGEGFLIYPNMPEYYFPDEKNPWEFLWIVSDDPKMTDLFKLFQADPQTGVFSFDDLSAVKSLSAFLIANNNRTYSGFEMLSFFLPIFQQKEGLQTNQKSNAELYLDAALRYIDLNIQNSITVSEITQFLGITQPYLFKLFQERFSFSPKQYIMTQKLTRAQNLLRQTDLSVTHIANSVGFPDVLSFSRCFKKKFGVSPLGYRNESTKKAP